MFGSPWAAAAIAGSKRGQLVRALREALRPVGEQARGARDVGGGGLQAAVHELGRDRLRAAAAADALER